jgi:hypothetical protein
VITMFDVLIAIPVAVVDRLVAGVAACLAQGPIGYAALAVIGLGLVLVFVVVPFTAWRNARYEREWRTYVTAYNEGRPIPAVAPRSRSVALALARNVRADLLLARKARAEVTTSQA